MSGSPTGTTSASRPRGGLVSYAVGGKQYVAVVSGYVGGYYHQMAPEIGGGNPTITVFALKPR